MLDLRPSVKSAPRCVCCLHTGSRPKMLNRFLDSAARTTQASALFQGASACDPQTCQCPGHSKTSVAHEKLCGESPWWLSEGCHFAWQCSGRYQKARPRSHPKCLKHCHFVSGLFVRDAWHVERRDVLCCRLLLPLRQRPNPAKVLHGLLWPMIPAQLEAKHMRRHCQGSSTAPRAP